jgi:hypothetical protein
MDVASSNTSSLTEEYIAMGYVPFEGLMGLSSVNNITFATRLTSMFNTYIQLIQPKTAEYTGNPAG